MAEKAVPFPCLFWKGWRIWTIKKEGSLIRLLRADEIECRAASVSEKGVSLLLYKDARVDQRILDETFGVFGWKRSHQCIDGNLYCTVEVYNRETGEWVSKQDVGTNGEQQKEKSQASDSFKRACFNWGIGRELYSAPFIWIPAAKTAISKKGDKYCCNECFHVNSVAYNGEREISGLVIVDGKNRTVYEMKPKPAGKTAGKETGRKQAGQQGMDMPLPGEMKQPDGKQTEKLPSVSAAQMDSLEKELQRTGVGMDAVKERYHVDSVETMSEEIYRKVMNALAKTESKVA